MARKPLFASLLCLGLLAWASAGHGDVMLTFTEMDTGEGLYASYPGPITQTLNAVTYLATPELPQLDTSVGITVVLSGTIGNIILLPPTGNAFASSYYADLGLEDPRYGQSTYEGTWSLFYLSSVIETGTFSILFTYEPEFPGLIAADLITNAEGNFIASPGSTFIPGFNGIDFSTHNPLHFSGAVSIWGNLLGTLSGRSPSQAVVPEPASVVLVGVGVLALLVRRMKKLTSCFLARGTSARQTAEGSRVGELV